MIHCENCDSLENLQYSTNPFKPHRNLCLCEKCMNVPFKYLKDEISMPCEDLIESNGVAYET